jgi:hypothetical protein
VYGGGSVGLMGILADAVLEGGGEVIGVIPRALATEELAHTGLTELRVVESMHERKALMATLADGFVALPGGLGTLEEILEALALKQLGYHAKPIVVLDLDGYYDPLWVQIQRGIDEGFIKPEFLDLWYPACHVDAAIRYIEEYEPHRYGAKWYR